MAPNYETGLFIDGELVQARSGKTFDVRSPIDNEVVAKMPVAEEADINAAVAVAERAQPAWAAEPAPVRAAAVRKFAVLMAKNAERLNELDRVCMGKPAALGAGEVEGACKLVNFFAGQVEMVYGQTSLNDPDHINLSMRQPYGVVGAIVPWNFPTQIFCHEAPSACGAGNAIILKTSEKSPLSVNRPRSANIVDVKLISAGSAPGSTCPGSRFPKGIVNVVSGAGLTGELIASHMKIRKIGSTGSVRAGRAVMQAAARSNLRAVTLELGGKSPLIVFDDADLESAASLATSSITFNSGQVCTASSRVYVQEDVAEYFKKLLVSKFRALKAGDPSTRDTQLGPQVDSIQAEAVTQYLEIGKEEGKVLVGGSRSEVGKNYISPTIFDAVPSTGRINVEEVFGPVLVIHTFKMADEAVKLANDTEYGLYASVFSENVHRALGVARRLEAGNVGVNCTSPFDAFELPFGGHKMSGIGRTKGLNAVLAWTEEKSVYVRQKALA